MSRRGFSLLEALFAMLMTFMVLGALAYVLQQSVATSGTQDELGALAEVSYALGRIRQDVANALSLSQSDDKLTVLEVDPDLAAATRLASADPFATDFQVSAEYLRQDGVLLRNLYNHAGTLTDTRPLLTCSRFHTTENNGLLRIEVSILYRRVSKSFVQELPLP